jgi:hypothetical protein
MTIQIPTSYPDYAFFSSYPNVFTGTIKSDGTPNTNTIKFNYQVNKFYYFKADTTQVQDSSKTVVGFWDVDNGKLIIKKQDGTVITQYDKLTLKKINDGYKSSQKPKQQEKQQEKSKGQSETPKEQPKPVDTKRTKPEFDFEAWKKQNNLSVQPQKPKVDCSEWTVNNLFEINFKPEFQEQAAKDFIDKFLTKEPYFLEQYNEVCGLSTDGTFKEGNIHKNGLVRFMTRVINRKHPSGTQFGSWIEEYKKTNSDKFKDETQMKESIVKKLKSIKETKSLKESLVNKLNKKKIEKKVNEVKVERNLIKLSESYTFKRDNKFYSELGRIVKNYKTTPNFLTENTDQTFLDAFKFVFSNGEEQIKKETINRLFKSLGIEEGTEIANQISEKLIAMETTEIYLNCLKVSSIILSTMVTAITSELSSEATGSLEGMVKSVINSSLNSSDNMEKLKYQINNVVCPVLEGYNTKIVDMPKQISNAFTNMI